MKKENFEGIKKRTNENDRRYSSGRQAESFRRQMDPAPALYNLALLTAAKNKRGVGFRDLAGYVNSSPATLVAIFDGRGVKLDVLKRLATYFGLSWLELFDVDRRIEFENGKPVRIRGAKTGFPGHNKK